MRAATTGAEGTPRPDDTGSTSADTDSNQASCETSREHAGDNGAPGSRRELTVTVTATLLFGAITALWLVATRHDPTLLERDWLAFDRAAGRVFDSGWASTYHRSAGEQLPFLYPPYALWLTLPLALFGPFASYLAVLAASLAAMAGAALALHRLVPERAQAARAAMALSLLSGPFLLVVITGQIAAGYLASILIGLVLRQRGRPRAGGLCWAFLAVKPNLAAPFAVYLALRRDRRALEAMAGGTVLLLASTIPMGISTWLGFRDALRLVGTILGDLDNWYGQVTLLAGLRVTLEPWGAGWATQPLWLAVVLPIGLAVVALWYRRDAASDRCELRLVGTVCLFTVAANPRLYCYDAIVLAVPAAAWYLARGDYRPRAQRAIGLCLGGAYLSTMGTFVGLRSAPLTALCCLGWLLVERAELRRGWTPALR